MSGRGEIGRHKRLRHQLSAPAETPGVELLKFGETFAAPPLAIPSQAQLMGRCRDYTGST
ncbi:hypothetical protein GFK88_13455 [Roseibium aggregatum]|nr:hypothetical protein GFK88_13455 [Roseibium aggregatum]